MANPDREIRIAVMGATGSGKSTFINKASGSNLPVSHSLESCTREVRTSRPFVVSGRVITLIDTPGFDDTTRSDTDILAMIAAYLSKTYEHGARLAGVIYMHRISDFKMSGTSKRNFKMFRELCGESSLKNVLIVTNMWSKVDPEIGEARESELASKNEFFKPVIDKGARMLRDDGTLESAHTTLRNLLNTHSAPLAIQQEIVDEQMPIETTAAGSELRRALNEQADRNKEDIRNLRAEIEDAMRAKHEERRGELQRELEKKQQECERLEQNSQRMAAEFVAERARLEAQIAQMNDEHQKQLQALEGPQGDVARVQSETRKQGEAAAAKKVEENTQSRVMEQPKLAKQHEEEERRKLVPPPAEQRSKLGEQAMNRKKSQTPEEEVTKLRKRTQAIAMDKSNTGVSETTASLPSSSAPKGSTPPRIMPPSPSVHWQHLTRPDVLVPILMVGAAVAVIAAVITVTTPSLIVLRSATAAIKLSAYVGKLRQRLGYF